MRVPLRRDLGLATVYGIVKHNEGFINVSSEPGRGTAFTMHLPRCGGAPVDRAITPTAEMPMGRGQTVLLVEDERSIVDVGKAMLVDLGYRVLTAGTPREALRAAESEAGRIALLVTDVVMPEMDGRALAAAIEKLDQRVRCLYTSGYTADVIAIAVCWTRTCTSCRSRSRSGFWRFEYARCWTGRRGKDRSRPSSRGRCESCLPRPPLLDRVAIDG